MSSSGSGLKALLPASVKRVARRMLAESPGSRPDDSGAERAIGIYDNFLSPEEFLKVQHWALNLPTDVTREDRDWSIYITLDFGECLMSRMWLTDDNDLPPEAQLFVDRIRQVDMIDEDASILLGVYRWQPKSGMGEHNDAHTNTAVTFYLNDVWNHNWFGDFIYYESKEHKLKGIGHAVTPVANRLVINKDTIYHKVTYSSELAVERISLQAFVVPKKDGAD